MFDYTDEQLQKKRHAQAFAERSLSSHSLRKVETADDYRMLWRTCAEYGVMRLPIPGAFGGLDAPLPDILAIMEGLGLGSEEVGVLFSVNAHIWACEVPILHFGTEEQRCELLPGLGDGTRIGAHCITEDSAGSDVWSMKTTYEAVECGYVLNGSKAFVTNGPVADTFLVFARKVGSHGSNDVSCFVVDKTDRGLTVGKPIQKMGLELSPMSSVYLEDCFVDATRLLGRTGDAMSIFNTSMTYERPFLLVCQIGLMERQLAKCVEHAHARKQFGKSISEFQSVSHRLADMKVRLEASKLLCYQTAKEMTQHRNTFLSSSIAKVFISEALVENSLSAIQIFGASGYMKETGIERNLRDFIASTTYSGTSEIQRNIIAELL